MRNALLLLLILAVGCGGAAVRPTAPADAITLAATTGDTSWTTAPCSQTILFARSGDSVVTPPAGDTVTLHERSAAVFTVPGTYAATGDVVVAQVSQKNLGCDAPAAPVLLPPAQATTYQPSDVLSVQIYREGTATRPAPASLELLTANPGFSVPVHTHDGSVEALYIESGTGVMTLGDTERPVHAGDVIIIPQGTAHSLQGDTTDNFRAVQFYAPSGPEQRFKQPPPHECPCKKAQ